MYALGEMKIHLDPNKEFKPCQVTTARQVPVHMKAMADTLIAELEKNGAIRRCDKPTPSTSPGHFVLKSCGLKVCLVSDYRILNEFILRPIRLFSLATDLMRQVQPEAKWFCKLDAIHGYFQVPLDEESQLLTAFLLPSAEWIYVVAPMGMNISSDEFNILSDRAVAEYLIS